MLKGGEVELNVLNELVIELCLRRTLEAGKDEGLDAINGVLGCDQAPNDFQSARACKAVSLELLQ